VAKDGQQPDVWSRWRTRDHKLFRTICSIWQRSNACRKSLPAYADLRENPVKQSAALTHLQTPLPIPPSISARASDSWVYSNGKTARSVTRHFSRLHVMALFNGFAYCFSRVQKLTTAMRMEIQLCTLPLMVGAQTVSDFCWRLAATSTRETFKEIHL
jgi:hypothetical protein